MDCLSREVLALAGSRVSHRYGLCWPARGQVKGSAAARPTLFKYWMTIEYERISPVSV